MPSGYKIDEATYQPLVDHLAATTGDEVVLTFSEIAALIGRRYLPEAAIFHGGWWANERSAHVRMWRAIGWRARAEGNNHRVIFTRDVEGEP